MKEKIGQGLFTIVAIVQTILHYLGLLAIILGVIALIFYNKGQGIRVLIGGASIIVMKYILGIIFHLVIHIFKLSNDSNGVNHS